MKRLLVSILCVAMLALVMAAAASATVTFNPTTGQGFIGRGDVISALGKDALQLPRLFVGWGGQRSETWDCSFSDGTTQTNTVSFFGFWAVLALQRVNSTGVVTGYETPGFILDFGFFYRIVPFPCPFVTPEGATLTHSVRTACGDWDAQLSVGGVEIPFTTPNTCLSTPY